MIIKRLIVKSFGKLKNLNVDLKPELNIIYFNSDSEKSTLKAFIKGIFYGLKRRSSNNEISEFDNYLPLDCSDFSGSIEYTISNSNYQISRDFITNKVVILNENLEDISKLYSNDNKSGILLIEKHLGLNEECFENTSFINLLDNNFANQEKISDALANIQNTGSANTSYKNTIDILQSSLSRSLDNSNTTNKPINIIKAEIERLNKDKYESVEARNTISELTQQFTENESQKSKIEKDIERLNHLRILLKKDNLIELYNKAKNYEDKIKNIENEIKNISEYKNFPTYLEETLIELLTRVESSKKILEQKTLELEQTEGVNAASNQHTQTPLDAAHPYEILSKFEQLQHLISQKNDYQNTLNQNITQLDRIKEASIPSFINFTETEEIVQLKKQQLQIKNKLIQFEKLMEDIRKFEYLNNLKIEYHNNHLSDSKVIDSIISKYKQLSDLKQKMHLTETEIKSFEKDLFLQNDIISKLSKFNDLPSDIEEVVMKLQDSLSITYNSDDSEVTAATYKMYWYQLLSDILVFIISFCLFLYGLYYVQSNSNSLPYLFSAIGLIGVIAFTVKSVTSFKKILVVKKSNAPNEIDSQTLNYESVKVALEQIYSSVQATDFPTFMKSLYSYKDAVQKVTMLNVDLNFKKQSLESISYQIDQFQNDISKLLSTYKIQHTPNNISEIDIANLQYAVKINSYNSDINILHLPDDLEQLKSSILQSLESIVGEKVNIEDASAIYSKYKREESDIEKKINEICDLNINSKMADSNGRTETLDTTVDFITHENEHLKVLIYDLIEKILNLDKTIKDELSKKNIKFKEDELVDENLMEILKFSFEKDIKVPEETQNPEIVISSSLYELELIKNNISHFDKETDNILKAAGTASVDEFFIGCENRKKFESSMEEIERLENMHKEILNGKSSEEILEKISQAKSELNINSIESTEEIDNKINEYQTNLQELTDENLQLKIQIKEMIEKSNNLNQIVEQIEFFNNKKNQLDENREALQIAVDIMKESHSELQREFVPKFQSKFSDIIDKTMSHNYNDLNMREYLNLNSINDKINIYDGFDMNIEQFHLIIKATLASALSSQNTNIPMFIGEDMLQYDDDRIKSTLVFLNKLSQQRQIVILACQKIGRAVIDNLNAENIINIVELNEINS